MDSSQGPVLTIDGGANDGTTIPLSKSVTTLGRREDGDVVVTGPGVSRSHAVIIRAEAGYRLRDLRSKNGTFVNEANIGNSDHPLRHGDDIRLGSSKVSLVFRGNQDETVELIQAELAPEASQHAHVAGVAPSERVMEFLRTDPQGADLKMLEKVAGVSGQQFVTMISRLIDSRQVRRQGKLLFAVKKK